MPRSPSTNPAGRRVISPIAKHRGNLRPFRPPNGLPRGGKPATDSILRRRGRQSTAFDGKRRERVPFLALPFAADKGLPDAVGARPGTAQENGGRNIWQHEAMT